MAPINGSCVRGEPRCVANDPRRSGIGDSPELQSWRINQGELAEHAKLLHGIAPLTEHSYRSRRGMSYRARQNPVARAYSYLSYRRAWELVSEINRTCRRAAVERQIGGKNGGGATLSPFGLSLVARYRKIERSAETVAREDILSLRADLGA
jgi:molybdate transport repressor ModE-like protein